MKIVIINQPTGNRGDQAAHIAFIEMLKSKNYDITVLFNGEYKELHSFFSGIQNVNYICLKSFRGESYLRSSLNKYSSTMNVGDLILSTYRKFSKIAERSDAVIVAPGGVCLGEYKSWHHIWNIENALMKNKKIAIWGRSIGPFYDNSKDSINFSKRAIKILKKVFFLGLRDKKSQELAENLQINYTPMIDSAFANVPNTKIPDEIDFLENDNYAIFVPNELNRWHPRFIGTDNKEIDGFYIEILKILLNNYDKVVMLPQLFGNQTMKDHEYFSKLKQKSDAKKIIVLPDRYNSNEQQAIIRHSQLVVGARYHSIIFAINNSIPFICLSYEHKMSQTLDLLNLNNYSYDLNRENNFKYLKSIEESITSIKKNHYRLKENLDSKKILAQSIVRKAFNELCTLIEKK